MKNHLREAIERHGLTQNELGRRCGLDSAYISKIATGQVEPRVGLALRIAREAGSTVEEIFGKAA